MTTRIETPRLVIRSLEAGDAEAWVAMMTDPAVNRFLPPWPGVTPEGFSKILEARHAMEKAVGHCVWAVEERETGVLVGQCGIRPVTEHAAQETELVYHYQPTSWGRGYATESATAVLARAFGALGLDRVLALVMAGNVGSCRVAEKAGMRYEGRASYFGLDDLKKFVAERSSWRAPPGSRREVGPT